MKKKILLSLVACFIAATSVLHFNFSQNDYNMDFSLADISVMAKADGESGNPWPCGELPSAFCNKDSNGNPLGCVWVNTEETNCKWH